MKSITCDVCGKPVDREKSSTHIAGLYNANSGLFGAMVHNLDVCTECMAIGKKIDLHELLMREWQRRVKEAE